MAGEEANKGPECLLVSFRVSINKGALVSLLAVIAVVAGRSWRIFGHGGALPNIRSC